MLRFESTVVGFDYVRPPGRESVYLSFRRIRGVFQGFGQVSIEPLQTTRTTFNPTLTPSSPITKYSNGILLPRNTWFSSLPEGSK